MEFHIQTTWDNRPVNHEPAKVILEKSNKDEVIMEISAPFFNDPPAPEGKPGEPFHKLWDYEVVEAFFLGKEEKYLEVEFSPHGQHLLLILSGAGNAIKMCLPVEYEAKITGNTWHGTAKIPAAYFPPSVYLFNAYAIHGSGDDRVYESLYPVPSGHFENPNFHRLEFFRYIEFFKVLPSNPSAGLSSIWKEALQDAENKVPLKC